MRVLVSMFAGAIRIEVPEVWDTAGTWRITYADDVPDDMRASQVLTNMIAAWADGHARRATP